MYLNKLEKGDLELGVGYLYAMPADEFNMGTFDSDTGEWTGGTTTDEMDEIGYTQDEVEFTREPEITTITSSNYGVIDTVASSWETTFSTSIMSYNADHVAKYMTGGKTYSSADGSVTTEFFQENDQPKEVALVYVCQDEDRGTTMELVMPRCKWSGGYTLTYSTDETIALDYTYTCTAVTLPTGKQGAAYRRKTVTATEDTED